MTFYTCWTTTPGTCRMPGATFEGPLCAHARRAPQSSYFDRFRLSTSRPCGDCLDAGPLKADVEEAAVSRPCQPMLFSASFQFDTPQICERLRRVSPAGVASAVDSERRRPVCRAQVEQVWRQHGLVTGTGSKEQQWRQETGYVGMDIDRKLKSLNTFSTRNPWACKSDSL